MFPPILGTRAELLLCRDSKMKRSKRSSLQPAPNLLSIPRDVLRLILWRVPAHEILKLCCVCKDLNCFCDSENFWKGYYQTNNPDIYKVLEQAASSTNTKSKGSSSDASVTMWRDYARSPPWIPEGFKRVSDYVPPTNKISCKIVMTGDGGVGKSALSIQMCCNQFVTQYDPTIEDSFRKMITYSGMEVLLDILDTAGQEEFHAMRECYIQPRGATAVIYSVDCRASFNALPERIESVRRFLDTATSDRLPIVIVGNKCDLLAERQVSYLEGLMLAKALGVPFIETSAKTRKHVIHLFHLLVDQYCAVFEKQVYRTQKPTTAANKPGCLLQ